ncbi:nuclease-related domain-containing protein [Aquibacillus salsiterrae]|uniref:NERD domain-containing protein n=1 Tax=Aquibacillus salsiterrae TaxID=2950439 RepID=A0A9X4AFT7_9BACI|nr:nuclease-related domain-containing protein [Aquibacillus salsiterrae]MDC3418256.1 NERD domain-containing protein [Aquibacillus salsiterrae]
MVVLKRRFVSKELMVMRALHVRTVLTEKETFHYLNLERGLEGEIQFDLLVEGIGEEVYVLNDLLFEVNNSYFQIDSIIISQATVHLFDIKNYQGDCYYELDKLYGVSSKREYKNPIDQLKRSTTLFGQLLQNLGANFLVNPLLIFINPEFTLYQAPMNQPIILPTQVHRLINDLNSTPSKLNDGHKMLAQKLLSLHQTKNPFERIPEYSYDQLQKGIYCRKCKSFMLEVNGYSFVCRHCQEKEKVDSAILRMTKEFELLFPNDKISTNGIYDWCDWGKIGCNKVTISRVLKKNYQSIGTKTGTYYHSI